LVERILSIGAEAIVYLVEVNGLKIVVKQRVSKPYRHIVFDNEFRLYRTKIEAKILTDLYLNKIRVPAPLFVDLKNYIIAMEYIEGDKLINIINNLDKLHLEEYAEELGEQIGLIHSFEIYHGDFTLGNVILCSRDRRLYVIDFGLAGYSRDIEEYAIDLHLMRRNILAINPDLYNLFFNNLLRGYSKVFDKSDLVLKRLEEIKLRGRYVEERLKRKLIGEKYIE